MANLTILFDVFFMSITEKGAKNSNIFTWIILDKQADQFYFF